MSTIKVRLKDASGNVLHPETDWSVVQNKPSFTPFQWQMTSMIHVHEIYNSDFLTDFDYTYEMNGDRLSTVSGVGISGDGGDPTSPDFYSSGICHSFAEDPHILKVMDVSAFRTNPTNPISLMECPNSGYTLDEGISPYGSLQTYDSFDEYFYKYDVQRSVLRAEFTVVNSVMGEIDVFSVFLLAFTFGDIRRTAAETNTKEIAYDGLYASMIGAIVLPHKFSQSTETGENASVLFDENSVKFDGTEYKTDSTSAKRVKFYKVFPFYDQSLK